MEKRRSRLVSIPRFGRGFQGMGSFDPMEVGQRKNKSSRPPVHRLDEPTELSLGMVASPQCPLPFRPATFIVCPPPMLFSTSGLPIIHSVRFCQTELS